MFGNHNMESWPLRSIATHSTTVQDATLQHNKEKLGWLSWPLPQDGMSKVLQTGSASWHALRFLQNTTLKPCQLTKDNWGDLNVQLEQRCSFKLSMSLFKKINPGTQSDLCGVREEYYKGHLHGFKYLLYYPWLLRSWMWLTKFAMSQLSHLEVEIIVPNSYLDCYKSQIILLYKWIDLGNISQI